MKNGLRTALKGLGLSQGFGLRLNSVKLRVEKGRLTLPKTDVIQEVIADGKQAYSSQWDKFRAQMATISPICLF